MTRTATGINDPLVLRVFITGDIPEGVSSEAILSVYDYNSCHSVELADTGRMIINDPNFNGKTNVYFRPVHRLKHYKLEIGGYEVKFGCDPYLYTDLNTPAVFETEGEFIIP
jgi:hypothetical protein